MQIEYLEEFSLVARYLNFAKASRALFISPSALSKHMAALESELGVELISRSTQGIMLTDAGLVFAKGVEDVMRSYEGAVDAARTAADANQKLIVSYLMGLCRGFLPQCAKAFQATNSSIAVGYKGMIMRELLNEIAERGSDVFIVPEIITMPKSFFCEQVHTYSYGAIMRKGHPLSSRKELTLDDLDGATVKFINGKILGDFQGNLLSFLSPLRNRISIEPDVEELDNWLFELSNNDKIGLELEANKHYLGSNLVFIPFASSCPDIPQMSIYAAYDKNRSNAVIESFVQMLVKFKEFS